jgi:hypothetical protein
MQSPTENPKELSEIEVARLERLIRRMSDFQRGDLWLWLDGGYLSDCSLRDAVNGKRPLPPEVEERRKKRRKAGELIDIETCEIICQMTEVLDPYDDHLVPPIMSCVGRTYFVRNKGGDEWIEKGDLPQERVEALWKRIDRERKAAGAILDSVGDVSNRTSPI